MIRLMVIVISITAITAALVHIRRMEASTRYETQRCMTTQMKLRRQMWDQHVRVGRLIAPVEVRRRAKEMALEFESSNNGGSKLADAGPLGQER